MRPVQPCFLRMQIAGPAGLISPLLVSSVQEPSMNSVQWDEGGSIRIGGEH